jgi:hypothetical protein
VKTPLRPSLDDEIYEVEQRLSRRREALPRVARAAGRSAMHKLASPAGLAAAAALGFLAGGGLRRANGHAKPRWVKVEEKEKTKGIALGGLAMSAVIALIKAQFGTPAEMARVLLQKVQSRKGPVAATTTSRRSDRRSVAG